MLGWKEGNDKVQFDRASKIKINDRIAIKRRMGIGSPDIKIKHVGIVEGIVNHGDDVIAVVNWLVINKDIVVESKGC